MYIALAFSHIHFRIILLHEVFPQTSWIIRGWLPHIASSKNHHNKYLLFSYLARSSPSPIKVTADWCIRMPLLSVVCCWWRVGPSQVWRSRGDLLTPGHSCTHFSPIPPPPPPPYRHYLRSSADVMTGSQNTMPQFFSRLAAPRPRWRAVVQPLRAHSTPCSVHCDRSRCTSVRPGVEANVSEARQFF